MKSLITLLLFAFTISGVQSQSFSWTNDHDSSSIQPKDTDHYFSSTIKNNTQQKIYLAWKVISFTSPGPSWAHYHCSNIVCWPVNDPEDTLDLNANDTASFDAHIMMLNEIGYGSLEVCVYDKADSAGSIICKSYDVITDTTIGILDHQAESQWLKQNAPNPFFGTTSINYTLPTSQGLLRIHDTQGRFVSETRLSSTVGSIRVGEELTRGVYFYSLWSEGRMIAVKRMQVAE